MTLSYNALDVPRNLLPGILPCRTSRACETGARRGGVCWRSGRTMGRCSASISIGINARVGGVGEAGAVWAEGAFGGVLGGARGDGVVVVVACHFGICDVKVLSRVSNWDVC